MKFKVTSWLQALPLIGRSYSRYDSTLLFIHKFCSYFSQLLHRCKILITRKLNPMLNFYGYMMVTRMHLRSNLLP